MTPQRILLAILMVLAFGLDLYCQDSKPPVEAPDFLSEPPVKASDQFNASVVAPAVSDQLRLPGYQPPARPVSRFGAARERQFDGYTHEVSQKQMEIMQLQNEAIQQSDEKKREELLTKLQSHLEQTFDESISTQGEELKKLEERVAKLKAAFARRKANRDRVIENYVDRVRLQAEGLTIPGLQSSHLPVRQPTFFTPATRNTIHQEPFLPAGITPSQRPD